MKPYKLTQAMVEEEEEQRLFVFSACLSMNEPKNNRPNFTPVCKIFAKNCILPWPKKAINFSSPVLHVLTSLKNMASRESMQN